MLYSFICCSVLTSNSSSLQCSSLPRETSNEYPEKSTDYYLWDKAKDICIIYVDAIIKEKGHYEKEYKIIKKEYMQFLRLKKGSC